MTIRIHANSLTLGSFDKINEWVEQIRENIVWNKVTGSASIPIILVGNKLDLISEAGRNVDKEDGQKLAKKLNIDFFEVSAKEETNIERM